MSVVSELAKRIYFTSSNEQQVTVCYSSCAWRRHYIIVAQEKKRNNKTKNGFESVFRADTVLCMFMNVCMCEIRLVLALLHKSDWEEYHFQAETTTTRRSVKYIINAHLCSIFDGKWEMWNVWNVCNCVRSFFLSGKKTLKSRMCAAHTATFYVNVTQSMIRWICVTIRSSLREMWSVSGNLETVFHFRSNDGMEERSNPCIYSFKGYGIIFGLFFMLLTLFVWWKIRFICLPNQVNNISHSTSKPLRQWCDILHRKYICDIWNELPAMSTITALFCYWSSKSILYLSLLLSGVVCCLFRYFALAIPLSERVFWTCHRELLSMYGGTRAKRRKKKYCEIWKEKNNITW